MSQTRPPSQHWIPIAALRPYKVQPSPWEVRLAVVLAHDNVPFSRVESLAHRAAKRVSVVARIHDVSGTIGDVTKAIVEGFGDSGLEAPKHGMSTRCCSSECSPPRVRPTGTAQKKREGKGEGRRVLTSLHHQMAEFHEQLTRPQLPGPGPRLGRPLTPLR